jgi:hypothetical protein
LKWYIVSLLTLVIYEGIRAIINIILDEITRKRASKYKIMSEDILEIWQKFYKLTEKSKELDNQVYYEYFELTE